MPAIPLTHFYATTYDEEGKLSHSSHTNQPEIQTASLAQQEWQKDNNKAMVIIWDHISPLILLQFWTQAEGDTPAQEFDMAKQMWDYLKLTYDGSTHNSAFSLWAKLQHQEKLQTIIARSPPPLDRAT